MISSKRAFVEVLQNNLEKNILEYWMTNTPDKEFGGFVGHILSDNDIVQKADKGSILNTRILWTFSIAALALNKKKYAEIAYNAFQYIEKYFIDYEHGGVYWSVDYKGSPKEKKKQIYAQAFAIYSFSEYYKLTKNKEALQLAKDIYHLIEKYSFDKEHNGYIEAFSVDWNNLEDVRLSPREINSKKTMNTHLHIMEAFSNLYRVWPDHKLHLSLLNIIRVFIERFIKKTFHLQLFFDEKWNPLDNIISFGHDIECSWLLSEAAVVLGDEKLIADTHQIALKMTDACEQAFDGDGGLIYEIEEDGNTDTDRHWWPQAEAMVGLVNAYQLSGKEKYLERAFRVWNFIDKYILDKKHGEWYYKVDRDGNPSPENEKVGFWKCPYHNSRACIEIMHRLSKK